MKELIQREIQSIPNLQERVAFKEMMEGVFLALYEKNKEMYQHLEKRVMDELAYDINRYRIRTGIVEKQYLDLSHHMMTPVCLEDAGHVQYKINDIRKGLQEEGRFRLSTVFIQGDFLEIEKMLKPGKTYQGILKGDDLYKVSVCLEPDRRYLKQIEHLYHLFMKNGIPWQTVNAPYLFKMMNLYILDLPDEAKEQEQVFRIGVDFDCYHQLVITIIIT